MENKDHSKKIKNEERKSTEQEKDKEKRKTERLQEQHEVTITVFPDDGKLSKKKRVYQLSKDISSSGVKISGNTFLPVGTVVKMELKLKNLKQKITALGKVKWIKILVEDVAYEAGVQFVDTPDETIRKIQDYISGKQQYKNLNPIGMPFWIFAKFNKTK
jgi:DNA primase catalytic subunit